jgi:signal transduction histidine kinase
MRYNGKAFMAFFCQSLSERDVLMSQSDLNPPVNHGETLHEILHLIANQVSPEQSAQQVLTQIQQVTGADAAFFMLFEEPHTHLTQNLDNAQLPSADRLHRLMASLQHEIYLSAELPSETLNQHYAGWGLIPLSANQEHIGALGLLFQQDVRLLDDTEQLLLALSDSLSILAQQIISATRQQKLTHNQNEFVRIVSHDLLSPLTSIKGFASMLESRMAGELNEKQKYYINKILSGVTSMTSLVENMQDAGRYDPETGFYEMERGPCDLTDVARRIAENHLLPAEKQDLTLSFRASDDIPIVNVDDTMIERSLTNLVDNAIKYTPNGGHIQIAVERHDDYIVITVQDNGFGINEENLRHLFQRHFRIRRREHKRVKGSGLGLFIVRSVARQHGGDAFVESTEGEGSTFGIRIPLSGENLVGSGAGASLEDL